MRSYFNDTNKNARIRTRVTRNGKQRTETHRRDSGVSIAASTATSSNSTNVFIDFPTGESVCLSGREARTLYRVLQAHYAATDRTW